MKSVSRLALLVTAAYVSASSCTLASLREAESPFDNDVAPVLRRTIGQQDVLEQMDNDSQQLQPRQERQPSLSKRQQSIPEQGRSDPVAAAKAVLKFPYLAGNASGVTDWASQLVQGDTNEAQLPWNQAAPFIQTPNTNVTPDGGWVAVPQMQGFDLNRTWDVYNGSIMPFYITSGFNPAAVKRAIISMPGKPRDAWKYANLYRNALAAAYMNESYGLAKDSVIIVAPVWLNEKDQAGGSVHANELFFSGSYWEAGGVSKGPSTLNHSISTYAIMDNFTDMLFNKNLYPNLNQVVVAGHSMGGQAAHRYAILKKQKAYDPNMSFWVGNPGSWTYLGDKRPYRNDSCLNTFNQWHYGIAQNLTHIPRYARKDVEIDHDAVVQRYLQRNVHMALGLLDNGPGDTHCEARQQGGNHLDRGANYVLHLADINKGVFPPSQTVDFVANTSHQDYGMLSTNTSLYWLFAHDYDIRHPDIVPFNPSERPKVKVPHAPHQKSYATHGNRALATALLAGSTLFIVAFFMLLPFLFPPNVDEKAFEEETTRLARAATSRSNFARFHHPTYVDSPYGQQFPPSLSSRKGSLATMLS